MSKSPIMLLAKSKRQGRDISLQEHLFDTEKAANQIFCLDKRWGKNWCRFFQLNNEERQEQFLLNLRVAGLFHDVGKANEDFYAAVSEPGFKAQLLRHEHLSALVLCLSEVQTWLKQNSSLDIDVITAAVLSHHLKASPGAQTHENGKVYRWCHPYSTKESLVLYLQHPEITETLKRIATIANLDSLPQLPEAPWEANSIWEQVYQKGRRSADKLSRAIKKDPHKRLFLVAVKAGLIVADAAASGLVREGKDIDEWIADVVHSPKIEADEIGKAILHPRAEQIEKLQKHPYKPHSFQTQMATQGLRTLLLAACGAGKTLGAWMWAEAQIQQYDVGKVIFLYPTRGTATEGFRDYVGWAPEADAALLTGTSRYELEAMAANPNDAIEGKVFRTEADERLFALGFWSRRFFSATVDQFLSFMEHRYQSICLLPVLADSVVIIDEVHSFDRKMFDILISFLKHFDIPVLCMTATLPKSRREELIAAGLTAFPTTDDRETLKDLQQKEEHPRYFLEPIDNFSAVFEKAVQAYQEGDRVLWVVNTVDRCLAIADKLKGRLQIDDVLTYHSRFRLMDRQKVHAATVQAFALNREVKDRRPAIAVTTQVCEMSLDLDADVLITEIAPVSALVQRFGRANRHLVRGLDFRAKLHPYAPPKNLPYPKEELETAQKFINEFRNQDVSQYQLAEALERHSQDERYADGLTPFLISGYYATPGKFRDTDEYAVPCILDRDLLEFQALEKSPKKYEREKFIINIPQKWADMGDARPSWLPKYLGVAIWEGHYNERQGFITKALEEVDCG